MEEIFQVLCALNGEAHRMCACVCVSVCVSVCVTVPQAEVAGVKLAEV